LSEIAQFEPRLSEPARSLIVYTRLSWTDAQTVICDSLVYDTDSCQLVATLLGARYTRVAAESLQKAIALVSTTPQPQLRMCKEHPTLSSLHQPPTAVTVASSTPRASVDVSPPTEQRLKEAVVSTLSMLLGIPISQISTTARLSDLGLDSLTSVELLRVFKENLQVDLARSVQTSTSTVGNLLTAAAASLQQQQHPRELVPRPLITPDASSVALTSPTDAISPFSSQCRSTATSDSLQQHCACAGCQVITRLVRIVAARLNGLATTILLDTQLEHLGLDSLATIDLEAELSTEFGRAFYIRQLPPSSTFCHLADAALAAHGLPSFADLHPPGDCGGSDISSYAHLLSLSPIP
jgi:acyl carrier protein